MQIPQDYIILIRSQTICQILKDRQIFLGNMKKLEVKKPATMRKKYMRWKNACLRQKKLWGRKKCMFAAEKSCSLASDLWLLRQLQIAVIEMLAKHSEMCMLWWDGTLELESQRLLRRKLWYQDSWVTKNSAGITMSY